MTQTLCDRCHKPIDMKRIVRPEDLPLIELFVYEPGNDNRWHNDLARQQLDLCPDCTRELKQWMGWKPNNEAK